MGFGKEEKEALSTGQKGELKTKIEVGLKYMELLNELLKQTLRLLEVKG